MDAAEVLSIIVERACAYVPEVSVGARNVKRPKVLTEVEDIPKEALTQVESPKEAYPRVAKVSAASDLVRINKIILINLFKAVG